MGRPAHAVGKVRPGPSIHRGLPTPRTGGCTAPARPHAPRHAPAASGLDALDASSRADPRSAGRSRHRSMPGSRASRTSSRSRTGSPARPGARAATSATTGASDAPSDDVLLRLVHTDPQRCPPGCIILWIQPSRTSRRSLATPEERFVHSMWVELSTVIHRASVSCDIRVIWGPAFAHSTQRLSTIRGVPSVFPGRPVETVRRAQSVDGARRRLLCTLLWITVDDRPYGVDDEVLHGGRRVGTDRSPTGRATFPQRDHGFVHTRFRGLTCTDTRFPRIPQPL